MLRRISFLGVGVLLASCATNEFKEEKVICTAMQMKEIPPRYEQERYDETHSRQVPTGETNCTTVDDGYSVQTNCKQIMKTEYYKTPAVRTVDRIASRRDAQIAACIQQRCNQKYGDAQCKS